MAAARQSVLLAGDIVVLCPHCEAEQPSPGDDSGRWLTQEVADHQGKRSCVACNESYSLVLHANVGTEHVTVPRAKETK